MTDIEALQKRIDGLEQRLDDIEHSSWLVSNSVWKRALAVVGHIIVANIMLLLLYVAAYVVITVVGSLLR